MCGADEYMGRVRQLPLHFERESVIGDAWLYRDARGEPVRVAKPECFASDAEREASISLLEDLYRPRAH